ncbi:MAG: GGDEF domain-containing protein [Dehalococcoidia bacterium]
MATQARAVQSALWTAGRVRPQSPIDAATLEAALRRAAVINATLLKLATLDLLEVDARRYHEHLDAAIGALETARTSAAVRMIEQRLAEDVSCHVREQEDLLQAREDEFNRTVALLADAVVQMRDSGESFTNDLIERSERVDRLTSIDDLRQLRARLKQEMADLRDAAQAQRDADARQIAALSSKVSALETRLAVAVTQSNQDPLTGLSNRAAWDQRMAQLQVRLESGDHAAALAMIDLDNFKVINDTRGHAAGDAALIDFADLCRQAFGADDFVARFGGDEFAVLLAAPSPDHAVEHMDRLIASVRRLGASPDHTPFTISVGLAHAVAQDTAQSLVRRADQALYAAKRAGRDRLVVARP